MLLLSVSVTCKWNDGQYFCEKEKLLAIPTLTFFNSKKIIMQTALI